MATLLVVLSLCGTVFFGKMYVTHNKLFWASFNATMCCLIWLLILILQLIGSANIDQEIATCEEQNYAIEKSIGNCKTSVSELISDESDTTVKYQVLKYLENDKQIQALKEDREEINVPRIKWLLYFGSEE